MRPAMLCLRVVCAGLLLSLGCRVDAYPGTIVRELNAIEGDDND
jgi:hypothetical protein